MLLLRNSIRFLLQVTSFAQHAKISLNERAQTVSNTAHLFARTNTNSDFVNTGKIIIVIIL